MMNLTHPATTAPARTPLLVEVYSDAICPWCFVGKRRLEKAISALGQRADVEVVWRPFELNPDMPPEGADRKAYRTAKFGSWDRSQALDAQVAEVGTTEGIAFNHDRMVRTPNTLAAHRLILLAGVNGRQDQVVEALFQAYFVEGRDIGDHATLTEVAVSAGIDPEAAATLFASPDSAEVRAEERRGLDRGVSGVPLFVIDGTVAVSGAQPSSTLLQAMEHVISMRSKIHPDVAATEGDAAASSCSIDGAGAC